MDLEVTSIAEVEYIISELDGNQFEVLPHYARVALAARFARRTVSLFGTRWPEVPTYGSSKYLQIIKQIEDYAAYAEPVSDIETLRNDAIISLGAIRRSVYGREDDSVPTAAEEQFVIQADEATRIVELALETTQTTPAESAGILQRIFVRFALLFDEIEPGYSMSMVDDFRKLYKLSTRENWDDNTLVEPQVFDRKLPLSLTGGVETLVELLGALISKRGFYGVFFIAIASWSQLKIAPILSEPLWSRVTLFDLSWATIGVLILSGSRYAISLYLVSASLLGLIVAYYSLDSVFVINPIIILSIVVFLLFLLYREVVDAVKKE